MNMTVMGAALAACALLSAGQERLHSKGLPSFPGVLEIRSNLPGRIRMEVPSVRKAPEKADVMKKTLLETGVFREITVNPVTGSVLFCYDADKIEPEVVEGVAVRLLGLDQAIEKRPESIVHQGIKSL